MGKTPGPGMFSGLLTLVTVARPEGLRSLSRAFARARRARMIQIFELLVLGPVASLPVDNGTPACRRFQVNNLKPDSEIVKVSKLSKNSDNML